MMENNLDEKILTIFRSLINSGVDYLKSIDYSYGNLVYIMNGKEVYINIYSHNQDMDKLSNAFTTVNELTGRYLMFPFVDPFNIPKPNFVIDFKVYIEGKWYNVPTLNRVEYAETLDKLDNIIKEKESIAVDSLLNSITK